MKISQGISINLPNTLTDEKATTAIEHARKLLVNTLKSELGDKLFFANIVQITDRIPTLIVMNPIISSTAFITFEII